MIQYINNLQSVTDWFGWRLDSVDAKNDYNAWFTASVFNPNPAAVKLYVFAGISDTGEIDDGLSRPHQPMRFTDLTGHPRRGLLFAVDVPGNVQGGATVGTVNLTTNQVFNIPAAWQGGTMVEDPVTGAFSGAFGDNGFVSTDGAPGTITGDISTTTGGSTGTLIRVSFFTKELLLGFNGVVTGLSGFIGIAADAQSAIALNSVSTAGNNLIGAASRQSDIQGRSINFS